MNRRQQVALWIGIGCVVLTALFPPWTHTLIYSSTQTDRPAGYSFISSPPDIEIWGSAWGVRIDMSRLMLQWVMVTVLVCGLLVTLRRPSPAEERRTRLPANGGLTHYGASQQPSEGNGRSGRGEPARRPAPGAPEPAPAARADGARLKPPARGGKPIFATKPAGDPEAMGIRKEEVRTIAVTRLL